MTTLFRDPLPFDVQPNTSDVLTMPSSNAPGINLAPAPPAAPGIGIGSAVDPFRAAVDEATGANAPPVVAAPQNAPNRMDLRRQAIDQMGGGEKFLAALGEFGAGMLGKQSPLDARIAAQRQERALQNAELRANVQLMHESVGEAMKLDGEDRTKYVDTMAPLLERNQPGMGTALKNFAANPEMYGKQAAILAKLPAHLQDLYRVDKAAFIKASGTAEGLKQWQDAYNSVNLDKAAPKARASVIGFDQLVPPELSDRIKKQGYMSVADFNDVQAALPNSSPAKMTPDELKAAMGSDTFLTSHHIMTDAALKAQKDLNKLEPLGAGGARDPNTGEIIAPAGRPSPLATLMAERDALPPESPLRAAYDNAIRKNSETAKQISPTITVQGDRSPYTNVQSDGNGGWVGLSKTSGMMEQIPAVEGVQAKPLGGVLSNQNQRERQIASALDRTLKPHRDVLDAYQRYEEVRASGDTSQANQMLAAQINQMSKTGTARYLNKADLERQLGTTFEGGDIGTRISNLVSQYATGTRTAETDRKLNAIADAMALASAKRMGQEMQNARASAPAGANADNITGAQPRIYGRYIIAPSGRVFSYKDAAEAQGKLSAMLRATTQQVQ